MSDSATHRPGEFPLTSPETPIIVLDTNVVLDWLLFREPGVRQLVAAVESGQLRWLATDAMRDELKTVIRRGLAARRNADPAVVLAQWDRHAQSAKPAPLAHGLRCTDADDQMFIDLAVHAGARWLFSRDRALLRLRRRAERLGLAIRLPEHWPAAAEDKKGGP